MNLRTGTGRAAAFGGGSQGHHPSTVFGGNFARAVLHKIRGARFAAFSENGMSFSCRGPREASRTFETHTNESRVPKSSIWGPGLNSHTAWPLVKPTEPCADRVVWLEPLSAAAWQTRLLAESVIFVLLAAQQNFFTRPARERWSEARARRFFRNRIRTHQKHTSHRCFPV